VFLFVVGWICSRPPIGLNFAAFKGPGSPIDPPLFPERLAMSFQRNQGYATFFMEQRDGTKCIFAKINLTKSHVLLACPCWAMTSLCLPMFENRELPGILKHQNGQTSLLIVVAQNLVFQNCPPQPHAPSQSSKSSNCLWGHTSRSTLFAPFAWWWCMRLCIEWRLDHHSFVDLEPFPKHFPKLKNLKSFFK
jgi:hypothetical protein